MIRRDFIKLVIASLSAYPFAATAQRSIPVIGVLSPAVRPTKFSSSIYAAFSQGMRELGYVEGKDYSIEWRFANGDYARLPELANELVELKVNVIFATSTPSILAVHKATTSIPIVMGFYENNPTDYGLAATLAHPGGNVTGLAAMQVESLSKHLDLTRAMLPKLNRLGILINPNVGSHRTALLKLQDAAEKVAAVQAPSAAEPTTIRRCGLTRRPDRWRRLLAGIDIGPDNDDVLVALFLQPHFLS
jgi:putative tryptophan/tyrosine transport system substrate-binding protein